MKKFLLIFPFIIILFSFLVAPYALAACDCYCVGSGANNPYAAYDESDCSTNVCPAYNLAYDTDRGCPAISTGTSGASDQVTLVDPLNLSGPEELYARIIKALLAFVGIASLVTFVYAGFIFLTSAGSPEKVKKAKDTMFYGIIGVVISIASYAILSFIFSTLETATGN